MNWCAVTRLRLFACASVIAISCSFDPGTSAQDAPPAARLNTSIGDVTITNARIVVGDGRVIERGSIRIVDGRIVAVEQSELQVPRAIDARGMSVVPGLIDTHVHLITGPAPASQGCSDVIDHLTDTLEGLLRRGFTTVLSPGDPLRRS